VTSVTVPFADLHLREDEADVRAAVERVMASGWFVLGPELEAFEAEFAAAAGMAHAVGVASGTDAIALLLRAAGMPPGAEVLVPALTSPFTALAVLAAGARPVFVDVEPERLTLDPAACEAAITSRTRAIVPVHLYGQAADMPALTATAERHGLALVEDCCQAHLATCAGAPVGTSGVGGAFSFYPTKNLGALGDAGAVITNDAAIAERVRQLRNGGRADRHRHALPGVNSRLDEIQAAVLRARLPRLAGWTARRRALAQAYRQHLKPDVVTVPERDPGHVYHLFPIRTRQRPALQTRLREAGVEAIAHYPIALPDQPAFAALGPEPCPVARQAAGEVLSLPLYPRLREEDVVRVAALVNSFQPFLRKRR
jgi:dTDP-3-amino-3,4,6-trideoxy-alpha-D-glucose transaminase